MSVESRIRKALLILGDPVQHGFYQPESDCKKYYTFQVNTLPISFGDDGPVYEKYLIQVHFFCPLNFNSINQSKETKRVLFEAGFTYPETVNATDEDGQHIVFECEDVEGIDC